MIHRYYICSMKALAKSIKQAYEVLRNLSWPRLSCSERSFKPKPQKPSYRISCKIYYELVVSLYGLVKIFYLEVQVLSSRDYLNAFNRCHKKPWKYLGSISKCFLVFKRLGSQFRLWKNFREISSRRDTGVTSLPGCWYENGLVIDMARYMW